MTNENGRTIKTDYIRTLLKRTNISVIYGRNATNQSTSSTNNSTRDKPIKAVIKLRRPVSLDASLDCPRPVKTVTFREPMTISGNKTMTHKAEKADEKPASPDRSVNTDRTVSETRRRPQSDVTPSDKQYYTERIRPSTFEKAEAGLPKFGTIRKSYEPDRRFRPLAVFRAFERTPDTGIGHTTVEKDSVRENGTTPGSDLDIDAEELRLMEESIPISTFPFVEDGEIDKHKNLNAEAEKNSQMRSPGPYDSYLKRLKLERKALDPNKPKDQPKVKKKLLFKRIQTRPKIYKDWKEETPSEKPDPPTKSKEERASRMLLDFKYSHAIEQFYGSKVRHTTNFSPMSDSYVNYSYGDETEVKNGCVVKTLGANVLNLQARTLPSCNPYELRMRRQLARERARLHKKQSIVSQTSVKSHLSQESFAKLHRISVGRKDSVSNAFLNGSNTSSGFDAEYARMNTGRKSVDSQTGLPEIRIDRVENMVSRSLDSSPEGPEYMRKMSQPHTKCISLNLPSVVMEDA